MDLQFYDANLTIESAGEWTLRVDLLHEDRGSAQLHRASDRDRAGAAA